VPIVSVYFVIDSFRKLLDTPYVCDKLGVGACEFTLLTKHSEHIKAGVQESVIISSLLKIVMHTDVEYG
jgi:hypothetical protein